MKFRAMFLALALVACGQQGAEKAPEAPQPVDPWALQIEVGRYGVMLSHVDNLTAERPGPNELQSDDPRVIARQLREVVWRYNGERSSLCGRGLFTDVACGPPYSPVWLNEPDTVTPTLDDLQTRSTELGAVVTRFWEAICADARTRTTNEDERQYVCAIE